MKKRLLSLVCVAVILSVTLIPLAASAASTYYVYTQNGKSLNLRSSMHTHAKNRVASIPYGAKVSVQELVDGTWAYVKYGSKTGYAMRRYLVKDPPPAKKHTSSSSSTKSSSSLNFGSFADTKYNATVRPSAPGGFVNLRWAPSKSMAVRARLYDGQALEVLAQNKTWAQVRVTGTDTVGFIMRSFITESTAVTGDS